MNVGTSIKVARNLVTSKAGLSLLKGRKHSPVLLFGAGVVGVIATTVLASKATLKLEDVVKDSEDLSTLAHTKHELARLGKEDYSDKDYKKDSSIIRARLVKDIAVLYAPSVAVGVLSIGALTGSHVILTKRNTALMAAYATVEKAFSEYRGRVTEAYGADADKKFMFGSETREIVEDGPNGPEVKTIETFGNASQYARIWSKDTSRSWEKRPELNYIFLKAQETYANDKLSMHGYLMLSDVYDSLGLERTPASQLVGWVKDNKRGGDNYITFGITDRMDRFADFVSGREGAILLDFNVDGVVYDLL